MTFFRIEILRVERNGPFGAALTLCESMTAAVGLLWREAVWRVATQCDRTAAPDTKLTPHGRPPRRLGEIIELYPRLSRVEGVGTRLPEAKREGGLLVGAVEPREHPKGETVPPE